MITFTRNTQNEVELDAASATELRTFASALEKAGEGIRVQVCQNDSKAGVAFFPSESTLVPALPPIGSTWTSSH